MGPDSLLVEGAVESMLELVDLTPSDGATRAVDEMLPVGVSLTRQGKAYWTKP